ncbi:MAG: GNAT family N-acetyltransferase, partial [Bryobacteraceae bacterium]
GPDGVKTVFVMDLEPIGPLVDRTPAPCPERVTLAGRFVSLEPLDMEKHSLTLWEAASGDGNEALWRYLPYGPFPDYEEFRDSLKEKAASSDPLFFAIVNCQSGQARGHAALMRIAPPDRCIEVGNVFFTPPLQRTPAATEAIYLLARYIFEELRYRRYEWKCDALNGPSRRAALRFGFQFEGTFRQHKIVKGRNRDTAWFSMLDSEWPGRKANFERWLRPENFDSLGRQIHSLSDLNGVTNE